MNLPRPVASYLDKLPYKSSLATSNYEHPVNVQSPQTAWKEIFEEVQAMPTCRECKNEVDELVTVKIENRKRKICEDCADQLAEEGLIAEESESVIQGMMGFKGRR